MFFLQKIFFCVLVLSPVWAHYDRAYFHSSSDDFKNRQNWMQRLGNNLKLSELALPGTHDSAAYKNLHGGLVDLILTQAIDFEGQLEAGIRFFDIRARHFRNDFPLHHGAFYLHIKFDEFLTTVTNFLDANPSETVLFRFKHEHKAAENTRTMRQTLEAYLRNHPRFLKTTDMSLTLGNARGRFIIVCDHDSCDGLGINYAAMQTQDDYNIATNWKLYEKWEKVRDHLSLTVNGNKNQFYVNYLSGSGGSFPYFVASGHMSPGTSASRLSTGATTPGFKNSYPDFPRVNCFIGICTIAYEGTNILTRDKIQRFYNENSGGRTVGIIVADFPGDSLIDEVVRNNFRQRIQMKSLESFLESFLLLIFP